MGVGNVIKSLVGGLGMGLCGQVNQGEKAESGEEDLVNQTMMIRVARSGDSHFFDQIGLLSVIAESLRSAV